MHQLTLAIKDQGNLRYVNWWDGKPILDHSEKDLKN